MGLGSVLFSFFLSCFNFLKLCEGTKPEKGEVARPGPPLSAGLGPARRQQSGQRLPAKREGARVSGTRPAPASCHLTRGRPPPRQISAAPGGALRGGRRWVGPRVATSRSRRGGRPRPRHRLGDPAGRPAARHPSLPPPGPAGSSGSARPAAALPHPPARASPRETGAPEAASPAPKPRCRGAPALTAIVRPGHAQSVNLVRGGHGGRARVSAEEAVRP